MSANIELTPITDHGRDLLDQLEHHTGVLPYVTNERSGARTYHLAEEEGVGALDAALDGVDPDWRKHLTLSDS
jgi:hypothetical protein